MPRAFDEVRPPSEATIADCVHCGFCLPTCPTYSLWGEEMDSPRGRIVLMNAGLEEDSVLSDVMVTHLDRCLGCMACVTACPSGVRYDQLIEDTRAQVERRHPRTARERVLRRVIFAAFTHPGRLRALVPALAAAHRLGVPSLARRRGGLLGGRPRLRTLVGLTPRAPLRATVARLPRLTRARRPRRGRVAFMQSCVQRVLFGDVNAATVAVLSAEGYDVVAPPRPRCCGALQLHAGYADEARALARHTIAAYEDHETVVVNVAGCGSAMKDYGHLLRDDPEWAGRAAAFVAKVRDVSEFLAEAGPRAERHEVPLKLAYHDPCHLAHAQGVRAQPRELLRAVPGLRLVEPADWEICCGSAGIYNLLQPKAAADLGRRKAESLIATGAEAVAAANPGCALQIAAHADALGRPLRVLHPMEVLHASIVARPV
jgi:glycolate oxidase iron-sulfur subunit